MAEHTYDDLAEEMRRLQGKLRDDPTLRISKDWATVLSFHTPKQAGDARLRRVRQARGYYRMHGVDGYMFYHAAKGYHVTELQRRESNMRWKTWMVDDPLHFYGMRDVVRRLPAGHLLVAGLGLGLFAHHLSERPDIESVTVVEIDPDVVTLITPTLPVDRRINMFCADFYDYLRDAETSGFDAILWDLAVGEREETRPQMLAGFAQCKAFAPNVPLYQFGMVEGDTILSNAA